MAIYPAKVVACGVLERARLVRLWNLLFQISESKDSQLENSD
jgi:hypothetical protein